MYVVSHEMPKFKPKLSPKFCFKFHNFIERNKFLPQIQSCKPLYGHGVCYTFDVQAHATYRCHITTITFSFKLCPLYNKLSLSCLVGTVLSKALLTMLQLHNN